MSAHLSSTQTASAASKPPPSERDAVKHCATASGWRSRPTCVLDPLMTVQVQHGRTESVQHLGTHPAQRWRLETGDSGDKNSSVAHPECMRWPNSRYHCPVPVHLAVGSAFVRKSMECVKRVFPRTSGSMGMRSSAPEQLLVYRCADQMGASALRASQRSSCAGERPVLYTCRATLYPLSPS